MRQLDYITPTRLSLYRKDKHLFYKRYQADHKWGQDPSTPAMMVGTAFDYYIKRWLCEQLGVVSGETSLPDDDWACGQGMRICEQYLARGGGGPLLEMGGWGSSVEMEFGVSKLVCGTAGAGVPLYGKPDLKITGRLADGTMAHCILDWKVNGGASAKRPSPVAGYSWRSKDGSCHKLFSGVSCAIPGIPVCSTTAWGGDWIEQICIYGWLSGVAVGETFVGAVDQLCCSKEQGLEELVRHRGYVSTELQVSLFSEIMDMWSLCQTGEYLPQNVRDLLDEGDPSGDSEDFRTFLMS